MNTQTIFQASIVIVIIFGIGLLILSYLTYSNINKCIVTKYPTIKSQLLGITILGTIFIVFGFSLLYCAKKCQYKFGEMSDERIYIMLGFLFVIGVSLIYLCGSILSDINQVNNDKTCSDIDNTIATIMVVVSSILTSIPIIVLISIIYENYEKSKDKKSKDKKSKDKKNKETKNKLLTREEIGAQTLAIRSEKLKKEYKKLTDENNILENKLLGLKSSLEGETDTGEKERIERAIEKTNILVTLKKGKTQKIKSDHDLLKPFVGSELPSRTSNSNSDNNTSNNYNNTRRNNYNNTSDNNYEELFEKLLVDT